MEWLNDILSLYTFMAENSSTEERITSNQTFFFSMTLFLSYQTIDSVFSVTRNFSFPNFHSLKNYMSRRNNFLHSPYMHLDIHFLYTRYIERFSNVTCRWPYLIVLYCVIGKKDWENSKIKNSENSRLFSRSFRSFLIPHPSSSSFFFLFLVSCPFTMERAH